MGTPLQNTMKNQSMVVENYKYKLLLNQSDVYSYILSKFPENTIEPKMIVWILLEYIRYLFTHSLSLSLIHLLTHSLTHSLSEWGQNVFTYIPERWFHVSWNMR